MHAAPETCGVVLAAGAARRFGATKQLAELEGRPLLQHAVDIACSVEELDRVVLVLGCHAERIRAAIAPGRAEVVVCEDWEEGLGASLRCGLAAAAPAEWIVVLLGDQPRVPASAIGEVVRAAAGAPREVLGVRATWAGVPGHPVALRRELAERRHLLRGDDGARSLLRGAALLEVDLGDPGVALDVDAPADLEGLR